MGAGQSSQPQQVIPPECPKHAGNDMANMSEGDRIKHARRAMAAAGGGQGECPKAAERAAQKQAAAAGDGCGGCPVGADTINPLNNVSK
ncbi:unnamed protein product [Nippostrongylus brasiliensis]|uniref:Uncharacterized protein n=1 Tax=Nippostrongylus brasiliensis TaxID=27835 RepID=A0A0N4XS11_NIPBR|nr:unnamed protein product [Nippostrongylus brasiliensis]